MARIRSVHPEQWTDDQFVTCSPLARLLALGLRNEADDNGVFEWNTVKLKMRLLPGDNCDVSVLLGELVATNQVVAYEAEGRKYGLIRNFQRYQKPKEHAFKYPLPPASIDLGHGYFFHKSVPSRPAISPELPQDFRKVVSDGEERREELLPTTSGASAPPADPPKPPDPKKRLFDLGVSLLTQAGDTEKVARSFLARFAHQDEAKLGEVLGHLATHPKVEPKSYIAAAFKPEERSLAL